MRTRNDIVQCWTIRRRHGTHEFLQLLRRPDAYMGNSWHPVSGGIEPTETAWQAALRELHEETGLTALELYSVNTVQTFYVAAADALWTSIPFCAIVSPDAPIRLNPEHQSHRWIPRDHLPQSLLWPGDRRVAAEICEEILDNGPAKPYLAINPQSQNPAAH